MLESVRFKEKIAFAIHFCVFVDLAGQFLDFHNFSNDIIREWSKFIVWIVFNCLWCFSMLQKVFQIANFWVTSHFATFWLALLLAAHPYETLKNRLLKMSGNMFFSLMFARISKIQRKKRFRNSFLRICWFGWPIFGFSWFF